MKSNLSPYLPFKPRRRELLGKQKIQYSDMNTPMKQGDINQKEKNQFLNEFKIKKKKEKKQKMLLLLILLASGTIVISLLFILKVE